jgi:hypothetical protein
MSRTSRFSGARRRLGGCLLPIGAVIAVVTLPFTAGFEGICAWNFVQFGHACYEGNIWLTVIFMVALLPFPLVGLMFVVARFVAAFTTPDSESDRYSDPNP